MTRAPASLAPGPHRPALPRRLARSLGGLGLSITMSALSLVTIAVPVALAAPGPPRGTTLSLSSDAAGASDVAYTVDLTMPSDVALAAATGYSDKPPPKSLVDLEAPAGTFPTKPSCSVSVTLANLSTGRASTSSLCAETTNANGSELTIASPVAVGAGERLEVVVPGLNNPTKAGVAELTVRASLASAATVRFRVVPAGEVSALSLSRSDTSALASDVSYTIEFKASPTGALAVGTGTITFTLPPGTFPAKPSCSLRITVTDITTKTTATTAFCAQAVLADDSQLAITSPVVVGGGDEVEVVIPGLENPAQGSHELSVGTSSDAAGSAGFVTTPGSSVTGVGVSMSTLAGMAATVIYAVTFSTSRSGAMATGIGVVVLGAPRGTFPVSPECGQIVATIADVSNPAAALAGVTYGASSVDSAQFTVRGCRNGIGTVIIQGTSFETGHLASKIVPLLETAPGSGRYSATIPPLLPIHGTTAFSYKIYCFEAVLPKAGPSSGGNMVLLHGSGFKDVTAVNFGAAASRHFKVLSSSIIEAIAPPGAGTVDVSVTTRYGTTFGGTSNTYSYGRLASWPTALGPANPNNEVVGAAGTVAGASRQEHVSLSPLEWLVLAVGISLVGFGGGLFLLTAVGGVAGEEFAVAATGGLILILENLAIDQALKSNRFNALIDPSGSVLDTNGDPLPGATVMLEQAPTSDGPFVRANPASPGVEPHLNPETTMATGEFHWEVVSDYYKIVASAPGCHAPGQPGQPLVSSAVLPVPSPQIGLALVLHSAHVATPGRPVVSSVSDPVLVSTGGTTVEIVGHNFTPSSVVKFGSTRSRSVTWASPEVLTVTAPPGHGRVNMTVTTAGGTSQASSAERVRYEPVPAVTGLSPSAGLTRGGTRALVYGSGLAGTVEVSVGGTLVSQFAIKSDHELEVTIPTGAAGTVNVRAEALVGWSPVSHGDRFTYETAAPPPTSTSANAKSFSPVSATYISASEGWVLGTVPCGTKQCFKLLHTTDDGTSWSSVHLPAIGPQSPDGLRLRVRFADAQDGWIFTTSPGSGPSDAFSTHTGGRHWSAIKFPANSASPLGVEDVEASGGVVDAAVQVGDGVYIFSAPISSDGWRIAGGPFALGAGPEPEGQLALHGTSGWFVEDNRVAVSGARRQPSGVWAAWTPPCSGAGGPVMLSVVTSSDLDAVCTEGVWTGHVVTVHLLTSHNGGATFGTDRSTPFTSVQVAAASGPSALAVGATPPTGGPAVGLEMTFDGGATWQTVYGRAAQGWLEMRFTTAEQGVAIVQGTAQSTGNTMVSTTDGGKHWSQVEF